MKHKILTLLSFNLFAIILLLGWQVHLEQGIAIVLENQKNIIGYCTNEDNIWKPIPEEEFIL